MKIVDIPNYGKLEIEHIVLDYNGTLANGGRVQEKTKEVLKRLCKEYKVYVITADTFGTVKEELKEFNLEVAVLKSNNHTQEKADFIKSLNADKTVAIGNGNNDSLMLQNALLSIAIIGKEGCSTKTLLASDITCTNITDALNLLLNTKALIATLRA